MSKKYIVNYCSGSTGYGWKKEYDRLDQFEDFVNEIRHNYTAYITVWDDELKEHIFWKDCLTYEPRIDMLRAICRDMRTKTRKVKL